MPNSALTDHQLLAADGLDGYWLDGHIFVGSALAGGDLGHRVDDVHSLNHATEYGVAEACRCLVPMVEEIVVRQVDEELRRGRVNDVRPAMASVPRSFLAPLPASFLICRSVGFCFMSGVKPPPWAMKSLMIR